MRAKKAKPSPRQVRETARSLPSNREELYGGGLSGNLIHPDFMTNDVYAWFQKVHLSGSNLLIDEEGYYRRNGHVWKVPLGVRYAAKDPLRHCQLVNKHPWYVTWVSPKTGKRLRKNFMSLPRAIEFVAEKAQYVDPGATIVSKHGYMIPAKLRNKLPKPWKWCPGCMKARKFYRVRPEQTFYAMIRDPVTLEMKERKLPLLMCRVCGTTNREPYYRRSNQLWVVRKFKRGVRRAKRR